jgi:formyl-CoA transferase
MIAAFAILAALRRRDLTGIGETIDVSMLGAAMQLMYPMAVETLATGVAPARKGNVGYSGSPAAETLTCSDGLLAIGANTPAQVMKMAKVMGIDTQMEVLLQGKTKGFVGAENAEEIRALITNAVRDQKVIDLEQRLNQVGVAAAQVRDLSQSLRDAVQSQALSPWVLQGDVPVTVPGLGFRTQGLYGGASQPRWTATASPSNT